MIDYNYHLAKRFLDGFFHDSTDNPDDQYAYWVFSEYLQRCLQQFDKNHANGERLMSNLLCFIDLLARTDVAMYEILRRAAEQGRQWDDPKISLLMREGGVKGWEDRGAKLFEDLKPKLHAFANNAPLTIKDFKLIKGAELDRFIGKKTKELLAVDEKINALPSEKSRGKHAL